MTGWFRQEVQAVPVGGEVLPDQGRAKLGDELGDPRWLRFAIAGFLVLGCALRVFRYAQDLPLWSDECFLAVNFITRGYRELLLPLDNGQIAPLLFLWTQRFFIDLGGFSEWTLRLFPLLCGLASMVLFWHLARRMFRGDAVSLLLAVGIFAVSFHPIRHAADAKPYASDLLVALLLLVPTVEWLRKPEQLAWLWVLAGMVPLALFLSYPAVFVAVGIGLGLLLPIWKYGNGRLWLAFGCFGLALVGSFATHYAVVGQAQSASAIDGLRQYWASSFPPLTDLPRLVGWLISAHTGSSFAYPGGGARGASTATFLACVIGAVALVRRRDGAILAVLTGSLAVALLASALRRYPYGSEARLMQFVAPSICLVSGLGLDTLLSLVRTPRLRRGLLSLGLLCLVVCGVVPQVASVSFPYRMIYDQQSREFARRFWVDQARDAELICAHLDLGIDPRGAFLGRKAWYLCNQMIYSPSRRRGDHPDGLEISAGHPLRCVLFEESPESPVVHDWLVRMQSSYRLRDSKVYHLPIILGEGKPASEDWWVFDFEPRAGQPTRIIASQILPDQRVR